MAEKNTISRSWASDREGEVFWSKYDPFHNTLVHDAIAAADLSLGFAAVLASVHAHLYTPYKIVATDTALFDVVWDSIGARIFGAAE